MSIAFDLRIGAPQSITASFDKSDRIPEKVDPGWRANGRITPHTRRYLCKRLATRKQKFEWQLRRSLGNSPAANSRFGEVRPRAGWEDVMALKPGVRFIRRIRVRPCRPSYTVDTPDGVVAVELPFVMGVLADLGGDAVPPDVEVLYGMAKIAAAAHCPFIAGASPSSMMMDSWQELNEPDRLAQIFEGPDYAHWQSLRDNVDSRYLGLISAQSLHKLPRQGIKAATRRPNRCTRWL